MFHDQAHELRHLARQRSRGGENRPAVPMVVVHGGKGGVGTTTIAANLAVALARHGRRVVLADVDLDHGGTANFNVDPLSGTVVDVLSGRSTIHEVLQRGPAGVLLLPGAWASAAGQQFSAAAQERFLNELRSLTPYADVVVSDTGSARGALAQRMWDASDVRLAVTTTDAAAILEAYAAIKVLGGTSPAPVHTLVNGTVDAEAAQDAHARLAMASQKFLGRRTIAAGQVETQESTSEKEPVMIFPAHAAAARSLDRVADMLWAQLQVARGEMRRAA